MEKFTNGEAISNAKVCWREHTKLNGSSELAKFIIKNIGHEFTCKVICKALVNRKKRKVLESFYICLIKPFINDRLDKKSLMLFRNGSLVDCNCCIFGPPAEPEGSSEFSSVRASVRP